MSMPTNTFDRFTQVGVREDLEDTIYNIAPTETPFLSIMDRSGKAENTFHEWQTDTLAAATKDNAVIEGDDVSADAATATVRVGNYTQLMDKVVSVTSTARSVNTAGRKDELPYQLAKRGRELKLDIEAACIQNNHAVAGVSDTTARKLGGIEVWIATAAGHGSGGSTTATTSGAPTATKLTDGTQRALTEALMTAQMQTSWTNGGKATKVFVGAFNKGVISTFTGNATKTKDMTDKQLVAAVDVYVGDFDTYEIIPSRNIRSRTLLGIDPEYVSISRLQPMKTVELAKTGHSDRRMLSTELTLVCANEKAHWKVADLTTS